MAFSLILVLSVGDWYLLAVLLRYRVAHVPGYLPLNLFLYCLTLFLGFVLCNLLVMVGTLIFVLCVTMLLGNVWVHPRNVALAPCCTLAWACCNTWWMGLQKLLPLAHPCTLILVLDDRLASKLYHILSCVQNPSMEL